MRAILFEGCQEVLYKLWYVADYLL